MGNLLKAVNDVLERWDLTDSLDSFCVGDSSVIEALRQAVQEAKTYKPMTDDERRALSNSVYECRFAGVEKIERAVIERLGLVWGD